MKLFFSVSLGDGILEKHVSKLGLKFEQFHNHEYTDMLNFEKWYEGMWQDFGPRHFEPMHFGPMHFGPICISAMHFGPIKNGSNDGYEESDSDSDYYDYGGYSD